MAIKIDLTDAYKELSPQLMYGGQGTNAYGLQLTITQAQISAATSGGANFGNIFSINGGYGPQPGRAAVIRGFTVCSTQPATFQFRVGVGGGPLQNVNIPELNPAFQAGPDSAGRAVPVYISCNYVIRNGQSLIAYITKILNGMDTTLTFYPDMYSITDDFNFNARHYLAWIGTSITNGSGPTSTAYMYHWLVASYLRKLGKSVKNETYGISGSTSLIHYTKVTKGEYDIMPNKKPASVYFIELAVNDASTAVTPTNYVARLRIYAERFLNNPDKKSSIVVILGGTPLENTTAWNNLLLLDAAASALVDELAATYTDRCYFVEQHNSYPRTDTTKYASTDTPGSKIHPNDSGQADIFANSWMPFFNSAAGQRFLNKLT